LSNLEIGVFLPPDAVPPAVDVVRKRTGPNLPEAVEFGDILNTDDGGHGMRENGESRTDKGGTEAKAERGKMEKEERRGAQ